jgi:hypothetical protein
VEPITCPYTGLPSDQCGEGGTITIVADPIPDSRFDIVDRHIMWHLLEMARLGEIIDNGDGTFSLADKGGE